MLAEPAPSAARRSRSGNVWPVPAAGASASVRPCECRILEPPLTARRSASAGAMAASTSEGLPAAATGTWPPGTLPRGQQEPRREHRKPAPETAPAACRPMPGAASGPLPYGPAGGPYRPRRSRWNASHSSSAGTTTPTAAGAHISLANPSGLRDIFDCANRFVRLETGRNRDAVLASQTVLKANGRGGIFAWTASSTTTGVTSTAVVSSERKAVATEDRPRTKSHSRKTLPRPSAEMRSVTTRNSPASSTSSVTTVIATTKARTGTVRPANSPNAGHGRRPPARQPPPASSMEPGSR